MKTIEIINRLHHHAVAIMLVVRVASLTSAPTIMAATAVDSSIQPVAQVQTQQELSEESFLAETNQARQDAGLSPLHYSYELESAARAKAEDMIENAYWDHFRPNDNKAGWDFIAEAGYVYHYAGENLARGFQTAHGITIAWLNSPSHRDNLLSSKYTDVGFATIVDPKAAPDRALLTVQLFAAP